MLTGVLHSKGMHTYMDGTYSGSIGYPSVPRDGPSHAEWFDGHKNQGAFCIHYDRLLTIESYFYQLWDIYTHGNCLRTFHGHMKAVKDLTFSNDGRQFLSCGYDRQIKLWDTETGQCLKRFSNGKIPYVVRFHPDEDKQNIFLAGMSDKKIIQVGEICILLS